MPFLAIKLLSLLLACSYCASANPVPPALAPAIALSAAEIERQTTRQRAAADGPIAGFTVDTSDRTEVLALYHSVYRASASFKDTHDWTGDTSLCLPGTTSADLKEDTRRRVNYYRAMVGLSASATFDDTKSAKAQAAALIMSRQQNLSHNPNQDFPANPCLSDDGQEGAANSNLSLGSYGPNAVTGQMTDNGSGNAAVGHRRWILFSRAQEFGTGDIPEAPDRVSANSLWVIGNFAPAPVPAPEIAWPPAGFVPYDLVPNDALTHPRWSFGYPGADFSQATVTMTQGETSISLAQEPVFNGFGDNTLVWRPVGIPSTTPAEDTSYTVTITGITNAPFTERSYQVTLINPFDLNIETVVSGPALPPADWPSTYHFNPVSEAEGYTATIASYTDTPWSEGAEPGHQVIDNTADSYPLIGNHSVAAGANAFHLATPHFESTENVVIDRPLIPQAGSQISFQYRRLFMHPDTKLRVQLSRDNGQSFATIHTIDGNNFGNPAQWDPPTFLSESVAIPAHYLGRHTMLRFMLDNTDAAFIGSDPAVGVYIDQITVSNALELTAQTDLDLDANASSFPYTPANDGEQRLLMAGLTFGNRFWGYGPALPVEATAALTIQTLSPAIGTINVPSDTGLTLTFAETVRKGHGDIVIQRVADSSEIGRIDVASGSVTIAGTIVDILLPFPLPTSTEVQVILPASAFDTNAGATLAGIGTQADWRFITAAAPVPATLQSLSPADNALDVAAFATLRLALTFNKDIRKGSGEISVYHALTDSLLGTIQIHAEHVSVAGATATIDAPLQLTVGTDYYVNVPAGSFRDLDGLDTPGLTDPTAWNFHVSTLGIRLPLARGWNLLSVPIEPSNTSLELLGHPGSTYTLDGSQIVPASTVQPKHGYLVFNPLAQDTLSVTGQALANSVTNLQPGWNLVGVAGTPPYLPRDFASALAADATHAWELRNGAYRLVDTLQPGRGYWIYSPPAP